MVWLSDIDEVTEVTEEGTNKGASRKAFDSKDIDFSLSIDEESVEDDCDSRTAPTKASKTSKNPSVMVSVDPQLLSRISAYDGEESDDESEVRKAALCCFSCCDLARACIVSNSIYMVLMVNLIMISIYEIPSFARFDLYKNTYDDDALLYDDYFSVEPSEKIQQLHRRGVLALVRTGGAILFSAVGVVGAWNFYKNLVLATAAWHCIYIIWSFADGRNQGAAIAIIFAYPNWHLYVELLRGHLTKENYEQEKYCCFECCYCGVDE